jgi:NRAMP (natural resistance-associated macrophage protein)-like metal ion transporter
VPKDDRGEQGRRRRADEKPDGPTKDTNAIEPGMVVEADEGDLGERDVSAAKVSDVVRDPAGNVEAIVVEKGLVFKKQIAITAERVAAVEPDAAPDTPPGKVTVTASDDELAALSAAGTETLTAVEMPNSVIQEVEETLPTAEGLRRLEGRSTVRRPKPPNEPAPPVEGGHDNPASPLSALGPGFLSGMAGNDASAVTSYSVNGATNGYTQLWLMLLATPLLQAVQYTCAKIGRVTQRGFAELLREHYGRKVAIPATLILVIANIGLIASDLVAIGTGLQLVTGLAWEWFVAPVAAILWYLTVYQSFGMIKRIFIIMSLAFVAYLITGIFTHPDWGAVLKDTFVPQIGLGFASISSAVALLGATVSPYTMFWQVQGEKEEDRPGTQRQQLRQAAVDVGSGAISGNLVAYFIIVCTSATLFAHHQSITSAADAARALEPLVGPFAKYLFAIGLIGAGLVAIPVLLASTSYGLSGTIGWDASLWKKPWQAEGFYLILTGALGVSLLLALLRFNPIQLMFGANVLQGMLAPVLVVFLVLVGNNRRIMRTHRLSLAANICLVLTALLMFAATALLLFGLITGQGS